MDGDQGGRGSFGVSQPVRRVEDRRLLTGAGAYVDDLRWDGQTRAVFLRSPVAHGDLSRVDVAAAKAAPGVLAVYVAADLGAEANAVSAGSGTLADGSPGPSPARTVLAVDRVRYVGEPIAMVVAETIGQARDAAELIELDIADRPVVVDMDAALAPGAPLVYDDAPGNLVFETGFGDREAAEAALAGAADVVTLELINNRVISNPMETRGVLAAWDPDAAKLHVEANTQGVWGLKDELAKRLSLSAEQVRVTTGDVGGGFGTKGFNYPEQVAVAFAARALGRPVKWIADRTEGFVSDAMGRDHVTVAKAGFDAERRLVALHVDVKANMGGCLSPFAVFIPAGAASRVVPGVYDVQAVWYGVKGVFTNTTPVDAYRGAGRPESIYTLERLMDVAARELGVDAIELRRKNFIPVDAMPYQTAMGETYDTGDFNRVIDAALAKSDFDGFASRKAASGAAGRLRGFGVCYYIESILGDHSETAKIDVTEDGFIDVYTGVQSNGQGHETVFAQMLHSRAGLPFERIRIVQGDSDRIATGGGTGGSRSVTMQGAAINATADLLIEQLKPLAEEELEVSGADLEFADGSWRVAGTDRAVELMRLAAKARQTGRVELATAEKRETVPGRSFPNGCHIAEVEVDPETGAVSVVNYTMVDDFGVLMNPVLAEGQAQGGVAQGLGQALLEFVGYAEDGQLQSGSFMDYAMPRAADAPPMAFYSEPTPSTSNPIGMKGCGEAGTVGALAAVTNAVLDALWERGVRKVDMPMTPQRVWASLQAAAPAAAAAE